MLKVLVVDDDAGLRLSVKKALNGAGQFEVYEAFDGVNALEKIQSSDDYNMVLMDVDMPRMNGLQALQKIKEHDPSIIVIIMTAYARIDDAVKAADVIRAARGADKAMIAEVSVFDLFAGKALGEGKKSLAIEVTLQPREKTLTDEEIDAVAKRIVAAVEKATGGSLRG